MAQPPGFAHPSFPHHIYSLRKAIYGLKQAPRAWFQWSTSFLSEIGFVGSTVDPLIFTCQSSSGTLILLLYVDDIIVSGSFSLLEALITTLRREFAMKDLEPLHNFLGIEVHRSTSGRHLSLALCTSMRTNCLNDTIFLIVISLSLVLSLRLSISPLMRRSLEDPYRYHQIVCALQHLIFTRPDISCAVNSAAQFLHASRDPCMKQLRIFFGIFVGR